MLHIYCQLGRRLRKISPSISPIARLCIGLPKPNPKSLVLVRGLPLSITNSSFAEAVSGIDMRKCEVEPGCAIHIIDEASAQVAASAIRNQLGYRAIVKSTALPSLVFQNLPNTASADSLRESFERFEPLTVRMGGKRCITITLPNAESSLTAYNLAQTIAFGNCTLRGHVSKAPDGRYYVQINNIPDSEDLNAVMRVVSEVVCKELPQATLSSSIGHSTVRVRLTEEAARSRDTDSLEEALHKVSFGSAFPVGRSLKQLCKPALFLRNTGNVGEDLLRTLCVGENKAERVQMTWKSRDILGDFAVAYFKSEEDAREAMKWIRSSNPGGESIRPTYRELSEPAVRLSGVPSSVTSFKLQHMFAQFKISRVDLVPSSSQDTKDAIVVVSSLKEMQNLVNTVRHQNPGKWDMTAEECPQFDTAYDFLFAEHAVPDTDAVISALRDAAIDFKSVSTDTNISAYVAFATVDQARQCRRAYINHKIDGSATWTHSSHNHSGGVTSIAQSEYPAYAIEVQGVSADESAQPVLDCAQESTPDSLGVIRADRMASVKFKKHAHVVLGMKELRKKEIGGARLRPVRNHPSASEGEHVSEYDEDSELEGFDRDHLKTMMTDYLGAEPAIRYQIARNYFERALYSAHEQVDVNTMLPSNAPANLQAEARKLLQDYNTLLSTAEKGVEMPSSSYTAKLEETTGKLFHIFIQKEDMRKFTRDFADWEATLGPASSTDVYAWNNFVLENEEDYARLEADMRSYNHKQHENILAKEEKRVQAKKEKVLDRKRNKGLVVTEDLDKVREEEDDTAGDEKPAGTVEGDGEKTPEQEEDEADRSFLESASTEKVSYDKFDVDSVSDHDGHLWSGIVVHADTTQKITPGGRVMSHRCLVCIGNMKGVGGYGMGKGETASTALSNAFRDALNNLIFIDLYENAALAHDIFARENNCYVYIRATPKTRVMVASPLAQAIFTQMGIVSASCKIVGRRHPYAMVRAIFKALAKHKNIDEIAKERGTRYLTLKWMYDNSI